MMRLDLFLEKFDLVNQAFTAYRDNKTNERDAWDNTIVIEDITRNKRYAFNERELHHALEFIWDGM